MESKSELWESRLNKYFFACGCKTGSAFFIILLPVYLLYLFFQIDEIYELAWADFGGVILVVFLSALLGKIIGLSVAYILLKKTIKEISLHTE